MAIDRREDLTSLRARLGGIRDGMTHAEVEAAMGRPPTMTVGRRGYPHTYWYCGTSRLWYSGEGVEARAAVAFRDADEGGVWHKAISAPPPSLLQRLRGLLPF